MYICVYIYMYIYIYMYTNIYICPSSPVAMATTVALVMVADRNLSIIPILARPRPFNVAASPRRTHKPTMCG